MYILSNKIVKNEVTHVLGLGARAQSFDRGGTLKLLFCVYAQWGLPIYQKTHLGEHIQKTNYR